MASLNADLRSYLSSSKNGSSGGGGGETSGVAASGKRTLDSVTSWWSSGGSRGSGGGGDGGDVTSNNKQAGENGNGWFNQAQKDPFCPALGKRQRILGFMSCIVAGVICFALAAVYAPFIVLRARKFALLYTMGSLFTISSFSLLWGPWYHLKHLFSADRLPFTVVYFTSMFLTLYFSLVRQSTLPTALCAVLQIIALFWYIVSYIPGGQTGLKFFSKLCKAAASKTITSALPV